jgi:hypothetical protein
MALTPKQAFIRRTTMLRRMILAGVIVFLSISFFDQRLAFIGWLLFVACGAAILWRLRCWNCGERLLKDGGAHLGMCKTGFASWRMCRHKTCGADLKE